MMKRLLAIASLLASLGVGAQEATFRNPVIAGDMPDPTVVCVDGTYYAAGTSSEWAPFYPLYSSADLVNWKQIGHLFEEQPAWTKSSFWAPELFHYRGKTYAYYTARRRTDGVTCIGVAVADRPEGPYVDHGPVVEFGTEAIDAFVLEDRGDLYITWKAYGLDNRPIEILACKLSADGLRLDGEPFMLLRDDARRGLEGQQWLKLGNYYYIVYAVNGCCGPGSDYAVSVARSKTLRGPYEKCADNPILHGGGEVQACGHGTITTTPDGRMFYLCHVYETGDRFLLGRRPMLQELFLDDDEWLRFRGGDTARLVRPLPLPGIAQEPLADFEDDFTADRLRPEWAWNYPYATPDIELAGGKLCLSGRAKDGIETGTALCLRAVSPDYSLETALVGRNEGKSGLTIYGSDRSLLFWGLEGDALRLVLWRDGKQTALCEPHPIGVQGPVYLRIEVRGSAPSEFAYSVDGRSWTRLDVAPLGVQDLLQWDRAARPGLYYQGSEKQFAEFEYLRIIRGRTKSPKAWK